MDKFASHIKNETGHGVAWGAMSCKMKFDTPIG